MRPLPQGPGQATGQRLATVTFTGESAHSAGAPWRGRSALDAVELMNVGWNFRREHLRLPHRSHYVVTNGGDQPNVVPQNASVWYYFRELDYPNIRSLWAIGDSIAQGAALMTGTTLEPGDTLDTCFALLFLKRATRGSIPFPSLTGGSDDPPVDNR